MKVFSNHATKFPHKDAWSEKTLLLLPCFWSLSVSKKKEVP